MTTSIGVWALRAHITAPVAEVAAVMSAPTAPVAKPEPKTAATATSPVAKAKKASAVAGAAGPKLDGLLDPNLTSRFAAVVFARSVPLRAGLESHRPPTSAPEPAAPIPAAPAQVAPVQMAVAPPLATLPQTPPQSVAAPAETAQSEEVMPTQPEVSPLVKDVPLPQPRPADLAPRKLALGPVSSGRRAAEEPATPAVAPAAPGRPSFFEKLFGRSDERGPALAYAAPEDGVIGSVLRDTTGRPAPVDRYTAVYNITTHTVTLPDGTQLEAHSGLGAAKDNPHMVSLRMVGATPPNVYDLTVREAPFHGVRALRLTPTGGTTYGRAGLLAHTYMLRGRSGESNGCVVFRDYPAFLRAYESGAVRRLAVVAGA